MHFLRLGFFDSFEQAEAAKERLISRYPLAWSTEVDAAERRAALGVPPAAAPRPAPARPTPTPIYVVTLQSLPRPEFRLVPLPEVYRDRRLYKTAIVKKGKHTYLLRLGFFDTQAQAEAARRVLAETYPQARVDSVSARERLESAKAVVTPARLPSPPSSEPAPKTASGSQLLELARQALTRGDNLDAIRLLSRALELPAGDHSEDALELLGLARERNGQPELAAVEYKLYLKLYPDAEGAVRVRQRLANLQPGSPVELKAPQRVAEPTTQVFGTFSQQYYRGNSKIDTTFKTGPTIGEEATLSLTDQSAIVNVLDVNARMRDERYDNRAVLSADYTYDGLEQEDDSRVANAYGEIKDRRLGYAVRLGRQPSTSGVLTRFDGGLFSFHFTPRVGVKLVAGEPVDKVAPDADRKFHGLSLEFGSASGVFGTNVYYFKQEIDGLTDREAIGTEVRYFSNGSSVFGLIDYETSYKEINILLLQGNWTGTGGTTYNLLYDYRKSPPLQTSNALLYETADSIDELLLTKTEEQIRTDARDRTAISKVLAGGFLYPLTARLQAGLDVTLTNLSGTPASGTQPATDGTGNVWTYAGKLIGTGMFAANAITVFGAAHTTSDAFDADSLALTHRVPFGRWRADLGLRYYEQENSIGTSLTRLTPLLRLDYFWRRNLALEFEYSQERTEITGPTQDETSVRDFFILGYRWDF